MTRHEKAVEVLDTPPTATETNHTHILPTSALGGKSPACDAALMIHLAAVGAASHALQQAYKFAALHAAGKPLFEKSMRRGTKRVLVRIVWPGVLMVCDPETGDVLARSEVGAWDRLEADFQPGASLADRGAAAR